MPEGGPEIEKESAITVETVLQSIEQTEKWWGQLQTLMQQGKPVAGYIFGAIKILNQLEEAAQNPASQLPKTPEQASKIKALWIISAPGTYFQAYKQDRYANKPWARWMDRQRINYAFKIGRQVGELVSGQKLGEGWLHAKGILEKYGPMIVYNGRSDESLAVAEAVKSPWLRIPSGLEYPAEKTHIIHPIKGFDPKTSSLDNIRTFRLPPTVSLEEGDEIGVVLHAPQAVRFLYILANFKDTIPQGVNLRVFSLPTPKGGFPEYPMQELRGTTYYHFIANPPIAAESPHPYLPS